MKLISGTADFTSIDSSTVVLFCFEKGFAADRDLKELNKRLNGAVQSLYQSGEFEGKRNQTFVLHTLNNLKTGRVVLAGLGEKKKVDDDCYRQAAGTISRIPSVKKSETLAFILNKNEKESVVSAVAEGFLLGRFDMKDYKTGDDAKNDITKNVSIISGNARLSRGYAKALVRGEMISEAVILARRLAAHPGNVLTPKAFASEAQSLAKKHSLKCTVLDEKQIREERMGALLAVAQGSEQPPRFVILEYNGGRKADKPIVLIGKGITFDTGGISLKQAADMDEMKGDMTGGAIMLAVITAASRLKLPLNLVTLVPLAENMPSGKATRPGDIVKSRKGKTIEIINTDAEGRLILADALDYANKFHPQAVIDIATLTGAALFVLGYAAAPVLGNNRKLMDALRAAARNSAEKVWEMPLWDEYRELMKSSIADLKNSGGRPAGTITAAAFLENFIGDWPWAHIDIAYVDLEKSGQPYIPKGPTGIGVRLLIELLSRWKKL
ncbi:MAG: leucyl aminopeptidase [bacterium]|jgi:leucyl aminopeptidase